MLTRLRQSVSEAEIEHLLGAWNIKVRQVTARVPATKSKRALLRLQRMMPLPLLRYQPADVSAHGRCKVGEQRPTVKRQNDRSADALVRVSPASVSVGTLSN